MYGTRDHYRTYCQYKELMDVQLRCTAVILIGSLPEIIQQHVGSRFTVLCHRLLIQHTRHTCHFYLLTWSSS